MSIYLLVLLLLLLSPDVSCIDDLPFFVQANFITVSTAVSFSGHPVVLGFNDEYGASQQSRKRKTYIKRNRKSVCSIFDDLGPIYARRAYRLKEENFWKLCRLLRPHLAGKKRTGKQEGCRNGAINGIIPTPTKISVALRWFAGGEAYDVASNHGISHSSVFTSIWAVVGAVNSCPELAFSFPTCHDEQRRIAAGFKKKSKAGFSCCAGAIDGLLVWMERPSDVSCEQAKCGASKFLCGRKKKFGLNLQGTVDAHRRFLDVPICHPASTSDCLAFTTQDLYHKLERPGFLAPGLCLFGDNAHVSTPYMAVPYKNVGGGVKDDCNFCHSQLRINVECAFGVLVKRWGVLREPLSTKIPMKKVTALVMCLCRLHNFCINCRAKPNDEQDAPSPIAPTEAEAEDLNNLASDALSIHLNGGVDLSNNNETPEALLHGGEHFDDVPSANVRRHRVAGVELPREKMCEHVRLQGLKRPTPKKWYDRTHAKQSTT